MITPSLSFGFYPIANPVAASTAFPHFRAVNSIPNVPFRAVPQRQSPTIHVPAFAFGAAAAPVAVQGVCAERGGVATAGRGFDRDQGRED